MSAPRLSLFVLALALVMGGCWDDPPAAPDPDLIEAANGRLQATFAAPTQSVTVGTSAIQLSSTGRFFGLYVPSTYDPAVPTPVIVMLHGFNGSGEQTVLDFRDVAERAGAVLVAPNSRGQTWDLILNNVGFDVAFIDGIMRWTFDHVNVDPTRLTLGGFSDGATYATWLGLRNGALFPRVAVFSGCATVPTGRRGTPKLFVTHGLVDSAFPIDDCSRPLVPGLRERGYSVEYREHELGHVVPIIIADEIFAWVATG